MSLQTALASKLPTLKGAKVLVVGDVMLDHYIFGETSRISPEAPVPILAAKDEAFRLGGAGNVALNILALGGDPSLFALVGADAAKDRLVEIVASKCLKAELVASRVKGTTVKTRLIAQRQQLMRIDREDDSPYPAASLEPLFAALKPHLPSHDVLILSDYGKGLVTESFMDGLLQLKATANPGLKICVDPKPQNMELYRDVFLITPNKKEALEAAGRRGSRDSGALVLSAASFFKRLRCRHVLITLGPEGMALFLSPSEVLTIPTAARKVFDVTGAGDTAVAVIGLSLAAGLSLTEACAAANFAAGLVVGEIGAAQVGLDELLRAIRRAPDISLTKTSL